MQGINSRHYDASQMLTVTIHVDIDEANPTNGIVIKEFLPTVGNWRFIDSSLTPSSIEGKAIEWLLWNPAGLRDTTISYRLWPDPSPTGNEEYAIGGQFRYLLADGNETVMFDIPASFIKPVVADPAWDRRSGWWSDFRSQDEVLAWWRGYEDSPGADILWRATNPRRWYWQKPEDPDDGYVVLSADGSEEGFVGHFRFFFFVHVNDRPFLVMGMYTENRSGLNVTYLPAAGYRESNGEMVWMVPGAIPMPVIDPVPAYIGHFVTFDLRSIVDLAPDSNQVGLPHFVADGLHIFIQSKDGSDPILLVDYVGLLNTTEMNDPVFSGHRDAFFKMFENAKTAIGSGIEPPAEPNIQTMMNQEELDIQYFRPNDSVLEEASRLPDGTKASFRVTGNLSVPQAE